MILSALAGFAAGLVHVLSGPDHLAAVAPLTVESERKPWLAGFSWGAGHTGGVWFVGAMALLMRGALPVEALSSWSERLVGVVLVGIGVWGLKKAVSGAAHMHFHEHDGERHAHFHLHHPATPHFSMSAHSHTHTAFAVGTLHGLAGSSHFLGVLPALALPSNTAALLYIVSFGVGSVIAMSVFSWVIGAAVTRWKGNEEKAYRWSLTGFSTAAILVGAFWLTG